MPGLHKKNNKHGFLGNIEITIGELYLNRLVSSATRLVFMRDLCLTSTSIIYIKMNIQ